MKMVYSSVGMLVGAVQQVCYFWDPLNKIIYHINGRSFRLGAALGSIPVLETEWKRVKFNKEIVLDDLNKGVLSISVSNFSVFAGKYAIDASFKAINGAIVRTRFRGWNYPSLNISYKVTSALKLSRPWGLDDTGFRKSRDRK